MVNKFDAMIIILALFLILGIYSTSKPQNSRILQIPFDSDTLEDGPQLSDGIGTSGNIFQELSRVNELAEARRALIENTINSRTSGLPQSANNDIFANPFTMDAEINSPDLSTYELVDYDGTRADFDYLYGDMEYFSILHVAAQGSQGLFMSDGIYYEVNTTYSIYRHVDTLVKYNVDLLLASRNNDQVYISFLTVCEPTTRSMKVVYFYLETIDNAEYPDQVSWNDISGLYTIYSSDGIHKVDLTEYLSSGGYSKTDIKELYKFEDVTNAMLLGATNVIEESFYRSILPDTHHRITQIYSFYKYGDVSVELSEYYRFEVEIDNKQGSTARINYEVYYNREQSLLQVWNYGFNIVLNESMD
jgi:hypothetical protein